LALDRESNSIRIFIDGGLYQTVGFTGTLMSNATAVSVAAVAADGSNPFPGYLGELRITMNSRYTATYTPATIPLPGPGR
jgi:hypothetical protein